MQLRLRAKESSHRRSDHEDVHARRSCRRNNGERKKREKRERRTYPLRSDVEDGRERRSSGGPRARPSFPP